MTNPATEPAHEESNIGQPTPDRSRGARAQGERKSADWWDQFWQRPLAATGRQLTCQRTAEEALRLLGPELARLPAGRRLRVLDLGCGTGDLTPLLLEDARLEIIAADLSAAALGQPSPMRLRGERAL